MNYLLNIISEPQYIVKFGKNNPEVDNDLDLGNFIKKELVTQPLIYEDAENGDASFETLLSYDALTAVSGGILISERLKEILEDAFPGEAQYFETEIQYQGNSTNKFFSINIYNKIPCYDLEASVYEVSPVDQSYEFEKIVPVNGPLEEYGVEYNMVRSIHDNKIVVSEEFKKLVTAHSINSLELDAEFVMEW